MIIFSFLIGGLSIILGLELAYRSAKKEQDKYIKEKYEEKCKQFDRVLNEKI